MHTMLTSPNSPGRTVFGDFYRVSRRPPRQREARREPMPDSTPGGDCQAAYTRPSPRPRPRTSRPRPRTSRPRPRTSRPRPRTSRPRPNTSPQPKAPLDRRGPDALVPSVSGPPVVCPAAIVRALRARRRITVVFDGVWTRLAPRHSSNSLTNSPASPTLRACRKNNSANWRGFAACAVSAQ
jgi:hypothetical protein